MTNVIATIIQTFRKWKTFVQSVHIFCTAVKIAITTLNGRCRKCFWNGSVSDYIQNLKDKNLNKSKKILSIIDFFQAKYGTTNILIIDHWDSDKEAIGLTEKSKQFLAYISTISNRENDYYLALENPSVDNELPYSPIGEFYNLSLIELEDKLIKHLKLAD